MDRVTSLEQRQAELESHAGQIIKNIDEKKDDKRGEPALLAIRESCLTPGGELDEDLFREKLKQINFATEIVKGSERYTPNHDEYLTQNTTAAIRKVARREGGFEKNMKSVGTVIFDLRGLKFWNDKFGMSTGDEFLQDTTDATENVVVPKLKDFLKNLDKPEHRDFKISLVAKKSSGDEFGFTIIAPPGFDLNQNLDPTNHEELSRPTRNTDLSNKLIDVIAEIAERTAYSLKITGPEETEGIILSNQKLKAHYPDMPDNFAFPIVIAASAVSAADIVNSANDNITKINKNKATEHLAMQMILAGLDKMEIQKVKQKEIFESMRSDPKMAFLLKLLARNKAQEEAEEKAHRNKTMLRHVQTLFGAEQRANERDLRHLTKVIGGLYDQITGKDKAEKTLRGKLDIIRKKYKPKLPKKPPSRWTKKDWEKAAEIIDLFEE